MAEVFSAFVCGFILALITLPLVTLWLLRARKDVPFLARALPEGVSPLLLSVPLANFVFLFWTGLGIVLGMLLIAANDVAPQGGLGSPNLLFTMIVIVTAVIIFLPPLVLLRRERPPMMFLVVCYLVLFGWVTPYLAR